MNGWQHMRGGNARQRIKRGGGGEREPVRRIARVNGSEEARVNAAKQSRLLHRVEGQPAPASPGWE